MDANEPGDLPARERPGTANRALRGANRPTWARTATAEVTVIDARALHEAAAHAAQNAVTVDLRADPYVQDTEPESGDRGTLIWLPRALLRCHTPTGRATTD